MDKFRLRLFFCELINLMYKHPGKPGFGNPVSWLVEQMCMYQDKFLDRIVGDFSGESHECRLNNAGLKMHWSVCRCHSKCGEFRVHISGDQVAEYADYVEAANKVIRKFNFDRR